MTARGFRHCLVLVAVLASLSATGCRTGRNYLPDATSVYYGGPVQHAVAMSTGDDTLDHIFVQHLPVPDSAGAGTVRDTRGASDHSPVWVRGILRP